jgi:hypothetical protein
MLQVNGDDSNIWLRKGQILSCFPFLQKDLNIVSSQLNIHQFLYGLSILKLNYEHVCVLTNSSWLTQQNLV